MAVTKWVPDGEQRVKVIGEIDKIRMSSLPQCSAFTEQTPIVHTQGRGSRQYSVDDGSVLGVDEEMLKGVG